MPIAAPPYAITPAILDLVAQIGEAIGRAEAAAQPMSLRLRRINRIRTIQGSLAIEGNTLSQDEISTILDGKPVIAPLREDRSRKRSCNRPSSASNRRVARRS